MKIPVYVLIKFSPDQQRYEGLIGVYSTLEAAAAAIKEDKASATTVTEYSGIPSHYWICPQEVDHG